MDDNLCYLERIEFNFARALHLTISTLELFIFGCANTKTKSLQFLQFNLILKDQKNKLNRFINSARV